MSWQDYTDSDGASIPKFFRRFINKHYGSEVMGLIDRAGRFHDYLTNKYPNNKTHNRKRFIKLLNKYNIPTLLIKLINFGLWIYDISPDWIARKLKQYQQKTYE